MFVKMIVHITNNNHVYYNDWSYYQSISVIGTTAGLTIHVNVRQVKVGHYKFTFPAVHAP